MTDAPHDPTGRPWPALTLLELEREAIVHALRRHGGNQVLASADLGVSPRVLNYKMTCHGLREYQGRLQAPKRHIYERSS